MSGIAGKLEDSPYKRTVDHRGIRYFAGDSDDDGASRIISTGMASEVFMIPDFVDASSLLIAVALMGAALYISLRIMQRKLKKIAPVEMLRERE